MTTVEAGLWVAGSLFVVSILFAGIGGYFDEKGQNEAKKASFMAAVALFGMSAICAGKSLLSLIIN